MRRHFILYGAVYIFGGFFLLTWIAQMIAQLPEVNEEGWSRFWASTFENWQSEFLSNFVLALVVDLGAVILFRKILERDNKKIRMLEQVIWNQRAIMAELNVKAVQFDEQNKKGE